MRTKTKMNNNSFISHKRIKFKKGFTLVEVLVALAVLLIGIMGTLKLHSYIIQANSYSKQAVNALSLAEDAAEKLTAIPMTTPIPDAFLAGSHSTGDTSVDINATATINNISYSTQWDCTPVVAGGLTVGTRIVLTVSWDEKGNARSVQLTTIK